MRRLRVAFVVLATWAALGSAAQAAPDPPVPPERGMERPVGSDEAAHRTTLDDARRALEARRYDRALALLRPVLTEPALDPVLRTEALFLRAWANAARGSLSEADEDWRGILALRPDFEPAPDTLPQKARTRFRAVRAATVGEVRIVVDPPDAEVHVDGRLASRAADGRVVLPIGAHVVSASYVGFDTAEQTVTVEGDRIVDVHLELVPNAGVVVIRTIPDGVAVELDGEPVGITAFPAITADGVAAEQVAELRLERVQLGEHRVQLAKPCHRVTTLRVSVDANLLVRSVRTIGPVSLEPVRGTVVLRGGPAGADVLIDGEAQGKLTQTPLARCPGRARIEVRAGARLLWRETVELDPDADLVLDVSPRPNVLVYGAQRPPAVLETLGWQAAGDLPAGAKPSTAEGWRAVSIAEDVDLVAAFVGGTQGSPVDPWLLMSPILGTVEPLGAEVVPDRPRWRGMDLGIEVADSRIGGPARVVRVAPDGPGARAGIVLGDRIVAVAGRPIESARQLAVVIDAQAAGAPLDLRIEGRSGEPRSAQVAPRAKARLFAAAGTPGAAAVAAAWARVDGVALARDDAAGATANLATWLARAGRHREAATEWEKVLLLQAPSVCRGSAAYHLGAELEATGRPTEAKDAFRIAAESPCAAFDAPEALVAPAARTRLDASSAPTSTSR